VDGYDRALCFSFPVLWRVYCTVQGTEEALVATSAYGEQHNPVHTSCSLQFSIIRVSLSLGTLTFQLNTTHTADVQVTNGILVLVLHTF
jgi:hypothetical protein